MERERRRRRMKEEKEKDERGGVEMVNRSPVGLPECLT